MDVNRSKPVAIWLLIGAAMIIVQVMLGGITRLTGSGLSITEWKPILGALPPMNEHDWNLAFDKYKEIAQYKYIHNHFTLSDFKFIYFWEWFHRNWGRFMGLVFIVPFVYFIYTRRINRTMFWPMVVLFLLGGLQGAIGWIMVASGVGTDLVYVDHIRLAVHFMAALVLLVYVVWFALMLLWPRRALAYRPRAKRFNLVLLALLTVQLTYGAFLAGTHGGMASVTWPTINGSFFPKMLTESPMIKDITSNAITVQFIHRNLAYLIALLVIVFTVRLCRIPGKSLLTKVRLWPIITVLLQVLLGVLVLVNYLDETRRLYLGVAHQLMGIFLLISLVVTYYACGKKQRA
ncbi:MAG: COX15/CtaA family protein [Niabella sp.]